MKVFCVSGYSKSGKTTTVVKLTQKLKSRGYKVVTVKDIHAQNFSMEKEGSDSWKHWQASKDVVFARGRDETHQIWHKKLKLNKILEHINADYVIIEGIKSYPLPKIVCATSKTDLDELVDETTFAISGIISNKLDNYKEHKVYNIERQIEQLTNLVEERVFRVLPYVSSECCKACGLTCVELCAEILSGKRSRKDCIMEKEEKIKISINNKKMELVPFVQNVIRDVIIGILKNLKGFEKGDIRIDINC